MFLWNSHTMWEWGCSTLTCRADVDQINELAKQTLIAILSPGAVSKYQSNDWLQNFFFLLLCGRKFMTSSFFVTVVKCWSWCLSSSRLSARRRSCFQVKWVVKNKGKNLHFFIYKLINKEYKFVFPSNFQYFPF